MKALLAILWIMLPWVAACGDDPQTVVYVTLRGRPTMSTFETLDLVVSNAGGSSSQTFTLAAGDTLPLTFTVTPTGRTGALTIEAVASNATDEPRGRGSVTVAIVPDGQVDVDLVLEPDDFVVNEAIVDSQFLVFDEPQAGRQIAVGADGSFIMTFENNCPLARCDTLARRFSAAAVPAVNGTTSDDGDLIVNQAAEYAESPSIAASAGGYMVAWLSRPDNEIGERDVKATLLSTAGEHLEPFDIGVSLDVEDDEQVTVFGREDGSYVVVWARARPVPQIGREIRARLYGATGVPLVNGVNDPADDLDFPVSAVTSGAQAQPHGAGLPGGGFVIVWTADGGGATNVFARVFGANHVPATGADAPITQYPSGSTFAPRAAATEDGFVVAWQVFSATVPELAKQPLRLRRFTGNGAPVSTEIPITLETGYFLAAPALAVRPADGAIGVGWADCNAQGDGVNGEVSCGIRFRLLRATGMPIGDEDFANTTIKGNQLAPSIQAFGDDGFLLGWTDESMALPDDRGSAVRARAIYPATERRDGKIGANCDRVDDALCADGLTCQPAADSTKLCHESCSAAACTGGGVCLNTVYCAFQ